MGSVGDQELKKEVLKYNIQEMSEFMFKAGGEEAKRQNLVRNIQELATLMGSKGADLLKKEDTGKNLGTMAAFLDTKGNQILKDEDAKKVIGNLSDFMSTTGKSLVVKDRETKAKLGTLAGFLSRKGQEAIADEETRQNLSILNQFIQKKGTDLISEEKTTHQVEGLAKFIQQKVVSEILAEKTQDSISNLGEFISKKVQQAFSPPYPDSPPETQIEEAYTQHSSSSITNIKTTSWKSGSTSVRRSSLVGGFDSTPQNGKFSFGGSTIDIQQNFFSQTEEITKTFDYNLQGDTLIVNTNKTNTKNRSRGVTLPNFGPNGFDFGDFNEGIEVSEGDKALQDWLGDGDFMNMQYQTELMTNNWGKKKNVFMGDHGGVETRETLGIQKVKILEQVRGRRDSGEGNSVVGFNNNFSPVGRHHGAPAQFANFNASSASFGIGGKQEYFMGQEFPEGDRSDLYEITPDLSENVSQGTPDRNLDRGASKKDGSSGKNRPQLHVIREKSPETQTGTFNPGQIPQNITLFENPQLKESQVAVYAETVIFFPLGSKKFIISMRL